MAYNRVTRLHRPLLILTLAVAFTAMLLVPLLLVLAHMQEFAPIGLAAVIAGQRFSYSDTVNERIVIASALDSLRATDVPLLTLIGRNSLRDGPATSVKHEWLEDEIRGTTSAVVNNPLAQAGTTLNVTTGDGPKFRAQDILRLEDELVRVTAVATDALTIVRAWGGSSDVAHNAAVVVTLIAPALLEGSDLLGARTTTKSGTYNYAQIIEEEVVVSSTNQATAKYVQNNDAEAQIANQLEVIGINFERALIFGRKVQRTASVPGAFDGYRVKIATNAYAKAGAALTQTMLLDALQDVWAAGGDASVLLTNATQKRRINDFLDPYRQANYSDTRLGTAVTAYDSDFGTVRLLLDRHMPTDEVHIINPRFIGFGPLRGQSLSVMKLPPKSKLYDVWQISGEYTSETRNEKSHAKITGLATTGL